MHHTRNKPRVRFFRRCRPDRSCTTDRMASRRRPTAGLPSAPAGTSPGGRHEPPRGSEEASGSKTSIASRRSDLLEQLRLPPAPTACAAHGGQPFTHLVCLKCKGSSAGLCIECVGQHSTVFPGHTLVPLDADVRALREQLREAAGVTCDAPVRPAKFRCVQTELHPIVVCICAGYNKRRSTLILSHGRLCPRERPRHFDRTRGA